MGTCGHQIAAEVLTKVDVLPNYLGREMWFKGREEYWASQWPYPLEVPEFVHKVDEELLDAVESFVLEPDGELYLVGEAHTSDGDGVGGCRCRSA